MIKQLILALLAPLMVSAYFRLTMQTYGELEDIDDECESLYGPGWKTADTDDLTSHRYTQLHDWMDEAYAGGEWPIGMSAFVTVGGASHFVSNRRYFATRHDGNLPGNYPTVHVNIHNHFLDVASWSGSKRILCDGPPDPPCGAQHLWTLADSAICYQNISDSCSCESLCMVLYSGWQYNDATEQCCCWA